MAFSEFYVCATCKPQAVEKISRGEPVGSLWRDGKRLVVRLNATLPDRCVRCNGPADGYRLKRALYWHHPAYYLFLFTPYLTLFLYLLVAIIVRKKSTNLVGLCSAHRSRRSKGTWICVGLIALSVAGVFVGAKIIPSGPDGLVIVGSIVAFLGGMIGCVIVRRIVEATRITRTHVFLKGACPAYLDELPRWTQ